TTGKAQIEVPSRHLCSPPRKVRSGSKRKRAAPVPRFTARNRHSSCSAGRRYWSKPRKSGNFFLQQSDDGRAVDGIRTPARCRRLCSHRNDLRLSEIHAGAFQGRRSLERLSGRNECSIWTSQEDASRTGAGISPTVWIQRNIPVACESLWPRR